MSKSIWLLAAALVGLVSCEAVAGASGAQDQVNVCVIAAADDSVGSRLVYALREGVRRSAGLKYVAQRDDSEMTITVLTLGVDGKNDGHRTIYSVVWTRPFIVRFDEYIDHIVGVCGAERIRECADHLLAITDELASRYVRKEDSPVQRKDK